VAVNPWFEGGYVLGGLRFQNQSSVLKNSFVPLADFCSGTKSAVFERFELGFGPPMDPAATFSPGSVVFETMKRFTLSAKVVATSPYAVHTRARCWASPTDKRITLMVTGIYRFAKGKIDEQ
jgi:hypothetical protein